MEKKLGVAVIHGVGSQRESSFAERVKETAEAVGRELEEKEKKDPDLVAWQPVFWADELERRQTKFLRDAKRANDLDYVALRKLLIRILGDAVAYQPVAGREGSNTTYKKIHRVLDDSMSALRRKLGGQDKPLLVLAHSLGSVIMSNYIWDLQQGMADPRPSAFERMETLVGFVTFGSSLPLFSFAHESPVPIQFPVPALDDNLKAKARWINFFDSDDILGYPLKQISKGYRDLKALEDREVNVGSVLTGWNPASHADYWTDRDFAQPVAKLVARFLN